MDFSFDLAVIGGGIVGLSVALEAVQRFPSLRVGVVEKEAAVARHQTGHNSGVIHSGVYYKPGSLKAKNCVAGAAAMVRFCQDHGIPYEICGKVIVATGQSELAGLNELLQRGIANGVPWYRDNWTRTPERTRASLQRNRGFAYSGHRNR